MRDTTFHPAGMAVALFGALLGTLGCGAQGNYSRGGDSGLVPGSGGASIGSGGADEGGSGGEAVVGTGGSGDIPIGGDTGGSGIGSGGSSVGTGGSGTGSDATGGAASGGGGAATSGTGGRISATGGTGTGGAASGGRGTVGSGGAATGGAATGGTGTGGAATGGAATGGAATGGAATGGAATGGAGTGGAATGGAGPWILSIDFVGAAANGGSGALVPLPAMAATETAGYKPATHWNSATGLSGTVPALVLSDGTITAAAVTWTSPVLSGTTGVWHIGFPDAPGDVRMMNGYLDPSNPGMPGTVTVGGMPAFVAAPGYDVYVYTLGDIGNNPTRTYKYTIGATSIMVSQSGATPTTFGGYKLASPTAAGNYVVFKGVTGTSFTLTATPVAGTQMRAPVNGIQIVSPTGS